jgi:hypothetical protein
MAERIISWTNPLPAVIWEQTETICEDGKSVDRKTVIRRGEPEHFKDVYEALNLSAEALGMTLAEIEANETNYDTRTKLVMEALVMAKHLGYPCGIRFDADGGAQWPVVVLQLPGVGEVAWHCAAYPGVYDGHTTAQKYERCRVFAAAKDSRAPEPTKLL